MAREKITVRSGVMINGVFTEIKSMSKKEREEWQKRQLSRMAQAFADHYTAHPEELGELVRSPGITVLG